MVNGQLTLLRDSRAMRDDRLALMLRESAATYAALHAPDANDRARLERLVIDNFELIDATTQPSIAGLFASITDLPPKLVAYFCHEAPDRAAAPFIVHAKAISEATCLAIVARHGPGARARAVARRSALTRAVLAALRGLDDAAIDRAIELRQPASAVGLDEPHHTPTPVERPDLIAMADLAADKDKGLFATALADATGLNMESATALCDDPTSRNMLFLLRFLGFDAGLGWIVVEGLSGATDTGLDARHEFGSAYCRVTADQAARRVRAWKLEELRAMADMRRRIANDSVAPTGLRDTG